MQPGVPAVPLFLLIWRLWCSVTFSATTPPGLWSARLICLLLWGGRFVHHRLCLGSEVICLKGVLWALRPTLASGLVEWLIMFWSLKDPRPAVLKHVGGNILHIVSADMRKVGVEDRQRGVKLEAVREWWWAPHPLTLWLNRWEARKKNKIYSFTE